MCSGEYFAAHLKDLFFNDNFLRFCFGQDVPKIFMP